MSKHSLQTDIQKQLFREIESSGELIFACGPKGVSANIVGRFRIDRIGDEDRLVIEDGTQHVHVDWGLVDQVEYGEFHGEGMLTFKSHGEILFRLYRPDGAFSQSVQSRCISGLTEKL
jgi:hypothetical protein